MASAAGLGLLFKADTSQAEGAISKLVSGLGSIGLAGMGIGVVKDTIGSVVGSVGDLIGASEALGDASARVGLVWGDTVAGYISDNAEVANSLGLTKTAYLDQVGALGQLATSLGVGQEAARGMAQGFTELAPQLAAYAGVEGGVASDALEKALMGKTKGLAALGIAITDADQKQAALSLGIKSQANKWTEAQTAQVMYAAVMAKTTAAQEAWAGNSGDVEVSLQRLAAAGTDLKTSLGDALLPIIAPLAQGIADTLGGALTTAQPLLQELADVITNQLVPAFTGNFQTSLDGVSVTINGVVSGALQNLIAFVKDLAAALSPLNETTSTTGERMRMAGEEVGNTSPRVTELRKFIDDMKQSFTDAGPTIKLLTDKLTEFGTWLTDHKQLVIDVGLAIVAFEVASTVAGAFSALAAVLPAVAAGFSLVNIALGPVGWVLLGIGVTVALLKVAWDNNFGGIQEKTRAAVDAIKQAIDRGKEFLAGLGKKFDEVVASLRKIDLGKIGSDIINGLKQGLESKWNAVKQWFGGLADALPQWLKDAWGIHSPSKVFEEIGSFITLGLASGIQKEDRKAVEALAAVIGSMNSVLSGVADFSSKLLRFVVPSDAVVADARSKFTSLLIIIQSFVKDFAYLGALLPVANISGASDQQKGLIDAVVRSKFGVGVGDLITGGEASWTTALTDIITKVASAWGAIADNLTKMQAAKMPTDSQLDALKAAAVGVILWAQEVTTMAPPNPVGVGDFGEVVKSASDMLANVAKLDLAGISAVTERQLSRAKANIALIGSDAYDLVTGWLKKAGTADERAQWLASVQQFGATVKAAADVFSAGNVGNLESLTTVTTEHLGVVKSNIMMMGGLVYDMVTEWLKKAGDEATQKSWLASVQMFGSTVKAAADILKATEIGELKSSVIVNLDDMRTVLVFVRDQLVPAIQGIVDGWAVAAEDAKGLVDRMQSFSGWIKAALDIAKATDIGELKTDVSVKLDYLTTILVWLRDVLAPAMEGIAAGWVRAEEQAKAQTDHMKQFADWIKVAVDIAKVAEVGDLKAAISVQTDYLEGILIWMRDTFAPLMQQIAAAWTPTTEDAQAATGRMKLFADWIKVAVDIAKGTEVGDLNANILVNMTYLEGILVWMRDTFVPTIQGVVSGWGMATDEAKDLVARMTLFSSILKAASDIAKSASEGMDLSGVTGSDLAARGAALKAYVTMVFDVLKDIASTMTTEEAQARAALATAAGTASKGLADVGDSIGKIMAMATGGLFGADPGRGDLGFMQRVKGRRADFNASVLTDSIKRMVGALTAALADMNLPDPKDPKIAALAALGDAFGKLAEGVTKLAEAKLPDAKRLAELAAIASNGGGLFPTTALATARAGAGTGGGNQVNNYNLNGDVIVNAPNDATAEGIVTGLGVWRRRP